jgi:YtkA-like
MGCLSCNPGASATTALVISITLALSVSAVHAQQRPPITVDWRLATTGKPLEREATIRLSDVHGKPIENGHIEITVDMPSMPMMHRIPKIVARPADEPGRYSARFTLEMAGEWVAQIEVKRPQRARLVEKFTVNQ